MLLVSQAADNAVAQIDFSPLAGKTVYLDATGIEKEVIDRGYLISIVKQQVVAAGALLHEDKMRGIHRRPSLGRARHGPAQRARRHTGRSKTERGAGPANGMSGDRPHEEERSARSRRWRSLPTTASRAAPVWQSGTAQASHA